MSTQASASSELSEASDVKVRKALENPKYVWRTVAGLAKETKLPRQNVVLTLKRLPTDDLVVSRGENGKKVYSTRSHYRKTQSVAGKLLSALSDRIK